MRFWIRDQNGVSRAAVLAACAVLLLGFLGAWIGAPPFPGGEGCIEGYGEGTATSFEMSLWPPGATRCVTTLPDGTVVERTWIPWREWVAIVLGAMAVGLCVAAIPTAPVGSRLARLSLGLLFGVLALGTFFGVG